jgi:hypothetical protein
MSDLALPASSRTTAKTREGLFSNRLTTYIGIVLVAVLASYGYWIHTRSIFACQADGYSSDRYLAYCGGPNYADFEHGAFWFDLEPAALNAAANADVLVIGNSRIQVALSTAPTADWFSAASARYYLLGFSYDENVIFNEKLLSKIRPRAKVYVINVGDFFDPFETVAAKAVLHDPDAQKRYDQKRFLQRLHEPVCRTFRILCGNAFAVFRSRETGAYYRRTHHEPIFSRNAVTYDDSVDQRLVEADTAAAADFLKRFAQGKCVILTNVPYPGTNNGNANAIAKGVGLPLVTPDLEGLHTADGYHLDQASAERWSQAFLQLVGPEIRKCLAEGDQTGS